MEKIGNYKFTRTKESELGRGSFSTVYLGFYDGPDTPNIKNTTKVAIKIIKLINLTTKAHEVLNDEISIMNMIKDNPHPNIVGCYDVIQSSNELYIVMEFCDSGDLGSILKKPIAERFAQFYFCQLANGLRYLDKHKIIHRDIKPKNILLTNSRKVLKIADFGFAKKIKNQSLHDTICGSPLFMAPEIMNSNRYNNQTDLWSIGMILYVMLYGNHPFANCKSLQDLKDSLSKTMIEIPPSNTKNKNVSDECLELLNQLLQKKVDQRIHWDDFFEHPWVKKYQYEIPTTNKKNEEYEKQLYSTSVGSLSKEEGQDAMNSLSKNSYIGSNPIIRMSCLEKLDIDDAFCDRIEGNLTVSMKDKNKTIQTNEPVKMKYSQDELLFEMDLDDSYDKKKSGKKIIEKKISK
ncbi:serine/threonine-protein kinase [Fadolivirus algeromassiliense]|jgi:serine/threonine-protein kinase ULK/ATG1|uniref:Serine/threonine-protein kinase n=1 Tax=Fadolivirus FV1/VV64 TaxID=3070911 RepID=A0A7D3QV35_9VIRU|nr:serine/threonine-protein kinase [Fadolivirus algeromassiliense]QKF93626.1 serine/threonine-protein kinase [Fadolivirus FV1/VV64]